MNLAGILLQYYQLNCSNGKLILDNFTNFKSALIELTSTLVLYNLTPCQSYNNINNNNKSYLNTSRTTTVTTTTTTVLIDFRGHILFSLFFYHFFVISFHFLWNWKLQLCPLSCLCPNWIKLWILIVCYVLFQ